MEWQRSQCSLWRMSMRRPPQTGQARVQPGFAEVSRAGPSKRPAVAACEPEKGVKFAMGASGSGVLSGGFSILQCSNRMMACRVRRGNCSGVRCLTNRIFHDARTGVWGPLQSERVVL